MIIITGAAGFIGSNLAKKLNDVGRNDLILVDDINHPLKIVKYFISFLYIAHTEVSNF